MSCCRAYLVSNVVFVPRCLVIAVQVDISAKNCFHPTSPIEEDNNKIAMKDLNLDLLNKSKYRGKKESPLPT